MPQRIEVPGMGVVEFPDGMSDDQISAAIKASLKPKEPEYDPSAGQGSLKFGPFDTGVKTPEWLNRGLAGAGKAMVDVGRGAGQWVGAVSRDEVAKSRALDAPLMETRAGTVGNVAGNVAMLAPTVAIPGVNTYTGAATVGALSGAMQPSTSGAETATNIGLGGAFGAAGQKVANTLGSLARSVKTRITSGQADAIKEAERLGIRLTPGKASGSKMLQRFEASAESNPITSSGFDSIKEANSQVLNRAAAKAIGENADELSTPVIARAESRIGSVFDSVKDKTKVPLDPMSYGARLRQIEQDSQGMLMGNAELAANGLWKRLDDFVNNQGGATREQLRQLSSNLGKAARNNMTQPNGDRELGKALFDAQNVVEDAIQGTLSKAQQAAYKEAREQYRNLMLLTAKTNVVNPASGNVNARTLANTLMQKDRGGFTMGRNTSDMYGAARVLQAFPDIVGDSGTATRSLGAADYLASLPGALASKLYLSQPVVSASKTGAGALGIAGRLGAPVADRFAVPASVSTAFPLSSYLLQQ